MAYRSTCFVAESFLFEAPVDDLSYAFIDLYPDVEIQFLAEVPCYFEAARGVFMLF